MPARRTAAKTRTVGGMAFRMPAISMPASPNIPSLEPKSFCISTTMTALCAGMITSASGFASTTICLVDATEVAPMETAPNVTDERDADNATLPHDDPPEGPDRALCDH